MSNMIKKITLSLVVLGLFILLAMPLLASASQEDKSKTSINSSKALNGEDLRLFRMAFNDSNIEQLLEHVSKKNNVPQERLLISTASMFVYRYGGQKTTQYSDSMIESPFWVVKVQDIESNRAYEVYVQDGTSIYKGRIMTDEQSQQFALHFKKYGKMESDLYNALASMKGEEKINVIIWPVIVYPPGFNPDDYLPENTVEYFIKTKGPYDFVILEPLVYSVDLPDDIIRELGKRKDVENITIGQKVGNNTRIVMRIKPTIVDEEIMPLEEFILNETSDITFMKPVFFARGLSKNTVLELNNRTDVINIAMEHTFRSEAAREESVKKEEKMLVVGGTWEKDGWNLSVKAVDKTATPGFILISLSYQGKTLGDVRIETGKSYTYIGKNPDGSEVALFTVKATIFVGASADAVRLALNWSVPENDVQIIDVPVESDQVKNETPVPTVTTPVALASPRTPGFEMVFGIVGILAVWWRLGGRRNEK